MRVLCFVAVAATAACGSLPATAPAKSTTKATEQTAIVPQSTELENILARVEQSLSNDLALDYSRPFANKSRERPESVTLLVEACRAGHKPSCWKAAIIAPEEEQAEWYEVVASNCRTGDMLSCRALPNQVTAKEPSFVDLPGSLGRSACSETACETSALSAECDAGFTTSCTLAKNWVDPAHRGEVSARAQKLALEDCRAGIADGCLGLYDLARADRILVEQQSCRWLRGSCGNAAALYDQLNRPADARDSLERACQYGNNPKNCADLGAAYLDHKYEEPVVGRGQQLIDDACRKLGSYGTNVPACKRASK